MSNVSRMLTVHDAISSGTLHSRIEYGTTYYNQCAVTARHQVAALEHEKIIATASAPSKCHNCLTRLVAEDWCCVIYSAANA